jgi:hypothetical protein
MMDNSEIIAATLGDAKRRPFFFDLVFKTFWEKGTE